MENQRSLSDCSWKEEKAEEMSRVTAGSPRRLILVWMPLGNLCNFSSRLNSCDESRIRRGGGETAATNTLLRENHPMNDVWIDWVKERSVKPTRFLTYHSCQVFNIECSPVNLKNLEGEKNTHSEVLLNECSVWGIDPMSILGKAEVLLAKGKFVQLRRGLP